MTQQPYGQQPYQQVPQQGYAPQYPQAPQQPAQQAPIQGQPPYPPQAYPQAPQQPYQGAPAPQGYGQPPVQQGYGQPYQPPAPQGQPQQQLVQGNLDDFYSQPGGGAGAGINWVDESRNQRPIGTTWIGTVARDVTNGDVQQATDPQSGAPKFFRDGRPRFQMAVPLTGLALLDPQGQPMQLPQKLQNGEGAWYVEGKSRDELARAMAEAGVEGAPKAGAVVAITLVQRRPNGGSLAPSNIVQVRYQPADGAAQAPAAAPAPQQAPQQVEQPQAMAQQPVQQVAPQGYAQEQYAAYAGQPQQGQPQGAPQGVPQGAPQGQPQQAFVPPAPAPHAPQAAANGVQPPPNMDAGQAALWAKITQQGGAPQA